jgi:glyoxylase-like metal-dependent hydrolase (beta-lactamase superfamily II)
VHDGEVIDLGQRKLKIIRTPGHTPDSLCLYDMDHRLLFTGDTFYAGAIYLFVPETDLTAYINSVEMLAKMAPKLDALIPSHNEPIASPEMLERLLKAAKQIQSGNGEYKVTDGLREYLFDGFTILRPNP